MLNSILVLFLRQLNRSNDSLVGEYWRNYVSWPQQTPVIVPTHYGIYAYSPGMCDSFHSIGGQTEWLPNRAGQRNWGSAYLSIGQMLVIGSPWSSHLTCCWGAPIITSPNWVKWLLGGHEDLDFVFFRYNKHAKYDLFLTERYLSLLRSYQIDVPWFISWLDPDYNIVDTVLLWLPSAPWTHNKCY